MRRSIRAKLKFLDFGLSTKLLQVHLLPAEGIDVLLPDLQHVALAKHFLVDTPVAILDYIPLFRRNFEKLHLQEPKFCSVTFDITRPIVFDCFDHQRIVASEQFSRDKR